MTNSGNGMLDYPETSRGTLLHNIVLFARVLRNSGVEVGAPQVHDFAHSLRFIDVGRRQEVKAAARCLFVRRHEDLPIFDRAFDMFWRRRSYDPADREAAKVWGGRPTRPQQRASIFLTVESRPLAGDEETGRKIEQVKTYSSQEILRQKDFGTFTRDEIEETKRLMQEMPWRLEERETRRKQRGSGEYLDLRATIRQNLKYGGEILDLARKQPKWKPRQLLVLCDISGSMENYSRILLQFIHSLRGSYENVESFVFSTRLTRITRQLETRDVELALREVARSVVDWSGGTRIGDALKTFNFVWTRRVMRPGAVVLIISDGWDRGEPELVTTEMSRLRRNAYRIIWLNPLLAMPGYEPLTHGLQAALPFVDDFLPVHNLASLEELGRRLGVLNKSGPFR
jgi:uncharacterized protein with von Willebrand factor type A (vWA) domain